MTSSQTDHATSYANRLLSDLGNDVAIHALCDHPALSFQSSGLLHITGAMLPVPLTAHVDGALMALKALAPRSNNLPPNGSLLMAERARLMGSVRKGLWSATGYGRLVDTADGRLVVNLGRDEDWDLLPAWLETEISDWNKIISHLKDRSSSDLLDRAEDLGLAVARDALPDIPSRWFDEKHFEKAKPCDQPLIVDLSGLWAGPLTSSLLYMTGAQVIKVESPNRPDGMRFGHDGFYALINGGKDCVALDFSNPSDLDRLSALLAKADVVIEASRPRAFEQLGISAEDYVARNPGQVWVRLTAYGRSSNRIGFGDDIGVSAGLSTVMAMAHQAPCFVGDAIADPVTAIHTALAVQSFLNKGGGVVLDISMADLLRFAMGEIPDDPAGVAREWSQLAEQYSTPLTPMRRPLGEVKALGQDTEDVCARLC